MSSYTWRFEPDQPKEEVIVKYRPIKNREPAWVAPEHSRAAQAMRKDFPRDDFGRPLEGSKRRLVVDPRPTILIPPRPTTIGFK